ncbi:MAG TPA: IS110 family transposase [Acidimicrobiales bacterium]|nr:IS110 family transposase [Acidimicrobiales bacterium]
MTTLGIDLAVRAAHVATLTNDIGEVVWTRRRFQNRPGDLAALSEAAGPAEELTVVMEPTRNAWVVVAAHFRALGAKVVLVAPEQSCDLRRYYAKHTKNDRLDSLLLARLPLLHPDGLSEVADLGPADALKRAVRRRVKLVADRLACRQRLDAMLDLLGPAYYEVLGTRGTKTSLEVLERYGDPTCLRRLGLNRLSALVHRTSGGKLSSEYAASLLAAANEAIALWNGGGLDFAELAWDLASEVRIIRQLDTEIDRLDERITVLYNDADPKGLILSAPGVGPVLAGGILGRLGDANRFANLAAIRSFSGMIPGVNQSGNTQTRPGITKQGDPGLRRDIWFAADLARHQDPQLAAKYHRLIVDRQVHHYSAVCHLATTLLTRIAACWRSGRPYIVRDVDGRPVDRAEARAVIAQRYTIPPEARRRSRVPDATSEPTR